MCHIFQIWAIQKCQHCQLYVLRENSKSIHVNDWPAGSAIISSFEKMSDQNSGRASSLHSKKSNFT